jgi:hypothetical protein
MAWTGEAGGPGGNEREMPAHWKIAVALAALCGTARAERTCAIEIDGDAALAAQVRAELQLFADDDTPCVAIRVACRDAGEQLVIELRDELGRSSQQTFTSPGGVAAFIVSWSRRPLLRTAVPPVATSAATSVSAPALTAPSLTAPIAATRPDDAGWRAELGLMYVQASGRDSTWGVLAASLVRRIGIWRYGGAVRALTGGYLGYVTSDGELTFGVERHREGFDVRAELIGGRSLVQFSSDADFTDYGSIGPHVGVRGTMAWWVDRSIAIEVSVGYDLARQRDPFDEYGREPIVPHNHFGAGVRWAL